MNRLVHLIIFIVISLPLVAQISIKVDPATFYLTGNPSESDVNYHVEVTNQSAFEIGIHWDRTITNPPSGWSSWICDKKLCYLPIANASAPDKSNMLAPGEKMDFQTFYFSNAFGFPPRTAAVRLCASILPCRSACWAVGG